MKTDEKKKEKKKEEVDGYKEKRSSKCIVGNSQTLAKCLC